MPNRLWFIDYQQYNWWGDAVMVESQGKYLLMDTCHENGKYVTKWIRDHGITEFALYVSHNHHDHCGKVLEYLQNFKITAVYLPADMMSTTMGRKIADKASIRRVTVFWLDIGSVFYCGHFRFSVIWRYGAYKKGLDPNGQSLVTMGECHGVKYLTAGDLSRDAGQALLKSGLDIHADIFKVLHHGCSEDGSAYNDNNRLELIKAIRPGIAVCNCNGESPSVYRAWAKNAYANLEAVKCNCYSVRHNGTVCLEIRKVEGKGVVVPSAERNIKEVIRNGRTVQVNKSAPVFWNDVFMVPDKTDRDLAAEVMLRKHGNLLVRMARLGSRYLDVQKVVRTMVDDPKVLHWILAEYCLKGWAGIGKERADLLGDLAEEVQKTINIAVPVCEEIMSPENTWGTGATRYMDLSLSGYDPVTIQNYIDYRLL